MNVGRVVLLFVYCFGAFIVPMAIILPLGFIFKPDPYLVRTEYLVADGGAFKTPDRIFGADAAIDDVALGLGEAPLAAAGARMKDGGWAAVAAFPSAERARDALDTLLQRIPRTSTTTTLNGVTYSRADSKRRGLLTVVGSHLFLVEGAPGSDPWTRLAMLPAITENPERNLVTVLLFDHWEWSLAALIAYILVQFGIFPRLGSWAARVEPEPGTVAVDGRTLRNRLLAINEMHAPFEIRQGRRDGDLTVEWRHTDTHWVSLMSAGGVSVLARIHLRIDSDRTCRVRAQDYVRSVQWNAGAGPTASHNWRAFKGIALKQFERGRAFGLIYKNGSLVLDDAYDYRFDINEMKNPIVAIITGSGWTYTPVVTFMRVFN